MRIRKVAAQRLDGPRADGSARPASDQARRGKEDSREMGAARLGYDGRGSSNPAGKAREQRSEA